MPPSRAITAPSALRDYWAPFQKLCKGVEKLHEMAASKDSNISRLALALTHLENAVLSSADMYGVPVHIKVAAAHKRSWKQNVSSNGRAVYSYVALHLHDLSKVHRASCREHPLKTGDFSVTETLRIKTSSLPGKKCIRAQSVFSLTERPKRNENWLLAPWHAIYALLV